MTSKTVRLAIRAGIISVFLLALLIFFGNDNLARYFWDDQRNPGLALLLNHGDVDLCNDIAGYYFNGEGGYNLELARRGYECAVEIDDTNFLAQNNLARVLFVFGELPHAYEHITIAMGLEPQNKRPSYIRGLVNIYTNNLEEAESDFKEFIEWSPNGWAAYNDLAWVHLLQEDFEAARDVALNGLDEIQEENIWLNSNLAVAYLNLGELNKAEVLFREITNVVQDISDATWSRAYPGNDKDEVREVRNDFIVTAHFNLGKVLKEKNRNTEALQEFRRAAAFLEGRSNLARNIQIEIEGVLNVDN